MTVSKKLVLITTLCATIPTAILCTNDNPQQSINDFKITATEKMIEFKNSMEKHYQPIKPYIYNPVGFASACVLSSILGPKVIAGTVVCGCVIAGSREIVQYLEKAEKEALDKDDN